VSLSLLLSAISGTAIAVAFPVITSSFDASLVLAGWVLSIYQLVSTAAMPLAGKASDVFGKKFTFIISLLFFTIGSVLCAIAPNIQLLILFRFIQGIGGGGFLPTAAGIVAETFPRSRQQLIGLFTSIFPIGQIIGPNIGGWLVTAYGWRSVFWFNVPLGIITLIVSAVLIKSGKREEGHIDLKGTGLFTGAIFAFLAGLSFIGNTSTGVSWPLSALLLAVGIALMIAFIRHVNRAENPIIDREVLRGKPFMAANIYNFIYGASVFGIMSFVPLYVVSIYGMTVFESGLILTPRSVSMMIASTVTSFSLLRWGYRRPMVVGTIVIVLSLFLLGIESPGFTLLGAQVGIAALLVGVMFLLGLGMGVAAPAANNACIELMPNRVASITGVRGMFRMSGGAIGIAIISLLLNNIGSMARGFTIAFFGLAIVTLAVSPLIFAMPEAPGIIGGEGG
jgi:EmrB/QacA subfamily drug resistance transporter